MCLKLPHLVYHIVFHEVKCMANKSNIASIVIISILILGMGGYIVYDQGWLGLPTDPILGIKNMWFVNGTNYDFDGAVLIEDTFFNITVNEGESVYLDFRAIINGYDEVGLGSVQFYVMLDGVSYSQPQFLYTLEEKTGHQLKSASFNYLNTTMAPGLHTTQIRVSELWAENPSLRVYSFMVQTILIP